MNKEKILEIANIIENAKPETFSMSAWFGHKVRAEDSQSWNEIQDIFDEDVLVVEYIEGTINLAEIVKMEQDTLKINCKTTACIAGWTMANEFFNLTAKEKEERKSFYEAMEFSNMESDARTILGLTMREAKRLFYCGDESIWYEVRENYEYNKTYDPDYQETWDIGNKEAADVLRKIVNNTYSLWDYAEEEERNAELV